MSAESVGSEAEQGSGAGPLSPRLSKPLLGSLEAECQGLMALSMVPGSLEVGRAMAWAQGPLSGGRRNRLWGNRGWGEKELLTGCIGYVLVRGPGKVSREEPGEDRRPRSTCADDHYGGQAGQQE